MDKSLRIMERNLFWFFFIKVIEILIRIFKLKVHHHVGEKIIEVLHAKSQSLPGEMTVFHQEKMVTIPKRGKGKQSI